jgi:hypothetical protein
VNILLIDIDTQRFKINMLVQFAYKDLYDAKSWLGWELGRMRDSICVASDGI